MRITFLSWLCALRLTLMCWCVVRGLHMCWTLVHFPGIQTTCVHTVSVLRLYASGPYYINSCHSQQIVSTCYISTVIKICSLFFVSSVIKFLPFFFNNSKFDIVVIYYHLLLFYWSVLLWKWSEWKSLALPLVEVLFYLNILLN